MSQPNNLFFNCKIHGETLASFQTYRNGKRARCKKCNREATERWRKRKRKENHKLIKKPIIEKCSILYCVPMERYYEEKCDHCNGLWTKIQKQYLKAFKPQSYEDNWERIRFMNYGERMSRIVLEMARNAMISSARDINQRIMAIDKERREEPRWGFDDGLRGGERNGYLGALQILQSHFPEINDLNLDSLNQQKRLENAQ